MSNLDVPVYVMKAFGETSDSGNPAGVVLNADSLSSQTRARVAKEVNLGEIVFVSQETESRFILQFFTPDREIQNSTHATLAAFSLLRQKAVIGDSKVQSQTAKGVNDIHFDGERVFMAQPPAKLEELDSKSIPELCLSLRTNHRILSAPPFIGSAENRFLLVPVPNPELLKELQPDFNLISKLSQQHQLIGYYAFSPTAKGPGVVTTRMFAPLLGIPEEAGTGMAAGPLACYLRTHFGIGVPNFMIEQGRQMPNPSPSQIFVQMQLSDQDIVGVRIGGKAALMKQINISVHH